MDNIKKALYAISIVLLIITPVWMLAIYPELKTSISKSSEKFVLSGSSYLVDERMDLTQALPNLIQDIAVVSYEDIGNDKIKITEQITGRISLTEEKFWEHREQYVLDGKSYEVIADGVRGTRLKPPIRKGNYSDVILLAFFRPIKLTYAGEEKLSHLNVYKFAGSQEDVTPPSIYPKLNITDAHLAGRGFVWVEPTTGYIVAFSYSWEAYTKPNKQGIQIEKGSLESTKESIAERVDIAAGKKQVVTLYMLIGILPAVIALALLASVYISCRKKKTC